MENISEYSEWLKQAGYSKNNGSLERISAPSPPILALPAIELCKTAPPDDSFYGHVFCWGMIGLYIMLIGSLVIYQLRSIFWLKTNIPKRNVQQSDNDNIELQSLHKGNFSKMLSV